MILTLCLQEQMIFSFFSWEQMLMHKDYSVGSWWHSSFSFSFILSQWYIVVVFVMASLGSCLCQPHSLFWMSSWILMYLFWAGTYIFICQFLFLCLEFESCCWFYICWHMQTYFMFQVYLPIRTQYAIFYVWAVTSLCMSTQYVIFIQNQKIYPSLYYIN